MEGDLYIKVDEIDVVISRNNTTRNLDRIKDMLHHLAESILSHKHFL